MTDKNTLDLARQWAADIDADRQTLSQDTIDAAADLISSLPDQWVGTEKLREVVADHHIDMSEELMEALGALLPAPTLPTLPTLADMTPEEREACVGMQADVESVDDDYRSVIAYVSETVADIVVIGGRVGSAEHSEVTPLPDLPRMEWPGNEPGNVQVNRMDGLARTGETSPAETSDNRRSSTARTHPESAAPEPASPRPEDVPAGEPWIVEYGGHKWVGTREEGGRTDYEWSLARLDGVDYNPAPDDEVTLIARLVPETTEQDDAEQGDEQEFDPDYIYTDSDGDEWEYIEGRWITCDTHAERVAGREDGRGRASLPEGYGPYRKGRLATPTNPEE